MNIKLISIFILIILCISSCKKEKTHEPIDLSNNHFNTIDLPKENTFSKKYIVLASKLIIREKPSRTSKAIGLIRKGRRVDLIEKTSKSDSIKGRNGYWFKIITMNSISGYVFSAYLKKLEPVRSYNEKNSFHRDVDCKHIMNSYNCAKIIESKLLKKYKNKVTRNDDKLIINIKNSNNLVYKNINTDSVNVKLYSFINYYEKINYFLIAVHYYEGGRLYFINGNNGNNISIHNIPVFSKNHDKFVVTNIDIEIGYSPNIIQIFQLMQNGNYKKQFEHKSKWGVMNPEWLNDNHIIVDTVKRAEDEPGYIITRADLEYNKIWHLIE
ncbi:MAG: SH3 domain-containing protein [Spirochaetia bacterium]|nr:SH3 domain-containing protein [Spirochaetia bacterium]